VLLLASLRDVAGWGEREVAVPQGLASAPWTPRQLWQELAFPPPAHHLPAGVRVAINQRFATPDTALHPGDELAFLPPITGG
jgi:molybdopterin synthase sulfur carrier subunit